MQEVANEILDFNCEDKICWHGIAKDLQHIIKYVAEYSQEFTDYKPQARLTLVEAELKDLPSQNKSMKRSWVQHFSKINSGAEVQI